MITGDQFAIAKEIGRRLGMGTNMYPSTLLLGQYKDSLMAPLPIDELIKKADGFAGVFPEHKYEIVKKIQEKKHICGMTGDRVNDAPALKKADIGIAVIDATDAARSASGIVLTEPRLSVIISAVLTNRAIFQNICCLHHHPYSAWFYAYCVDLEVRLFTFHGSYHCYPEDGTIEDVHGPWGALEASGEDIYRNGGWSVQARRG